MDKPSSTRCNTIPLSLTFALLISFAKTSTAKYDLIAWTSFISAWKDGCLSASPPHQITQQTTIVNKFSVWRSNHANCNDISHTAWAHQQRSCVPYGRILLFSCVPYCPILHLLACTTTHPPFSTLPFLSQTSAVQVLSPQHDRMQMSGTCPTREDTQ
jgi:hypothetical protein